MDDYPERISPEPTAMERRDSMIVHLRDEDPARRLLAIAELVALGEPAIDPLLRTMVDRQAEARIAAARALGTIAETQPIDALSRARIIDALTRGLSDRNVNVRRSIVGIMGEVGGDRVIYPLVKALRDRDIAVRAAAADVLGKLKNPDALPGLLARFNLITGESEKVVYNSIADAIDSIQRAMASSSS
jgi:HEAT repeat protein